MTNARLVMDQVLSTTTETILSTVTRHVRELTTSYRFKKLGVASRTGHPKCGIKTNCEI